MDIAGQDSTPTETARGGAAARKAPGATALHLPSRTHVLVVCALTLACYLPSLAAGFVFDDVTLILDNEYAQSLAHVGRCFHTDLFDTSSRATGQDAAHYYRPLVCASYALNWALAGPVAWSYHLTNVLAHLAACLLALRIATRWLASARLGTLAALAFSLHPSRSENVVWISGRTDVMMGLFVLAAVELCWLATRQPRRPNALAAYAGAAGCFVAAVLSKEYAVSLPAVLAVDWWLARRRGDPRAHPSLLIATVAFGMSAVAYLAIRAAVYPIRPPLLDEIHMPLGLSVAYVLLTVGYYTERVLLPWPQVFDYKPIVVVNGAPELELPSVLLGAATVVALGAVTVHCIRRNRDALGPFVGGLILFVPLSNVSYTGFPGTASDRFLYLPMLLWMTALLTLNHRRVERWFDEIRTTHLAVGALSLVSCAVTWVRTLDYVNDEAFWRAELDANPTSPRALAGLGRELALRGLREEGFALIKEAYQPSSLRHKLIARPTTYYVGLLQMHGDRLADGNLPALAELSDELLALTRRQPRAGVRRSADLELRTPVDDHLMVSLSNAHVHLATAGVNVAARLGQKARAHEFLTAIPEDAFLPVSTRYNLALALGRLGDARLAREQLAHAVRHASAGQAAAISSLATRLDEPLAPLPPNATVATRLAHAKALFDWGNYLLAARTAAAAYDADPQAAWKDLALYLAWCRLDEQAVEIAARYLGADEAKRWFAGMAAEFSERTRDALRPAPGDRSWRRPITD